jgi:hypothetical protein
MNDPASTNRGLARRSTSGDTAGGSIGIMQPYLFPYLGYFQLMVAVDRWVYFDTPQFIRHGWINRNRVMTTGKDDWKYIRIPLTKVPHGTPITQVTIAPGRDWRRDLLRALDYYEHHRAPFLDETVDLLERALDCDSDQLSKVVIHSLRSCRQHLGIEGPNDVFSEMDLTLEPVEHAGQWALRICQALEARRYVNPPGGREIFRPAEFSAAGVELRFIEPDLRPYNQRGHDFIADLSIVDCLMWLGREGVRNRLAHFRIIE